MRAALTHRIEERTVARALSGDSRHENILHIVPTQHLREAREVIGMGVGEDEEIDPPGKKRKLLSQSLEGRKVGSTVDQQSLIPRRRDEKRISLSDIERSDMELPIRQPLPLVQKQKEGECEKRVGEEREFHTDKEGEYPPSVTTFATESIGYIAGALRSPARLVTPPSQNQVRMMAADQISAMIARYFSGVIPSVRRFDEIRETVSTPWAGTTTGRVNPGLLKIL